MPTKTRVILISCTICFGLMLLLACGGTAGRAAPPAPRCTRGREWIRRFWSTGARTRARTSAGPCARTRTTSGWVAIDPGVQYVYIGGNGGITGYTVNASNGALTPISGGVASLPGEPGTVAIVKPQ